MSGPGTNVGEPSAGVRGTGVRAALAGVAATAMALGVAELVAGLVAPAPSLVLAVGNAVVDLGAGTPVKDLAISLFGTGEKTALVVGTVALALLIGAGLGVLARQRELLAAGGIVLFGVLGVAATAANPLDHAGWAAVAAVPGVAVGVSVLRFLVGTDRAAGRALDRADAAGWVGADRGRREVVRMALGLTALGGVLGTVGRMLVGRSETSAARAQVQLPPVSPAPAVPGGAAFADVEGLSPLFTPNDAFYRIDTALMSPVVDPATWSLRVHGMVDREVQLTYAQLLDLAQHEADITIACVSNEVGGDLIGNARWQGVKLADVLDMAGVQQAAEQVVGRSVDGWTAGFPIEAALDGRDAMIAVAMNGEPLPVVHGFPARLVVPGLYGYVSATKWLQDIELTTWDGFDGYWVPRGWSKEGPVKTQSRIDVPRRGANLAPGPAVVAGVAWAQRRGVAKVEVSIDEGPWEEAVLADELSIDTWRQWRLAWDATPGRHTISVRATDGTGETQGEMRVPVAPDGAEGYHSRSVTVG